MERFPEREAVVYAGEPGDAVVDPEPVAGAL